MPRDKQSYIDALIELVPPPERVRCQVAPERWEEIERELGTILPIDYKQLNSVYGSGEFCDLFYWFNPLCHGGMNLIEQAHPQVDDLRYHLKDYEWSKQHFPEACRFPSFPEPNGLLPLGGDTNGGRAFWLTEGPPDEWPVILYPREFCEFERHPMPLVEFLVRWLSGDLPDCFSGVGGYFADENECLFRNW